MPRVERFPEPHVYQAYGIYLLQSQHRLMRSLKRAFEPSVHGHKTWQSSFVLMDYLLAHPIRRGTRVMEIGCGWGPASIFCAKRFGARVTAVDMDRDVFPYLEVLAALNDVEVATLQSRFEDLGASRLAGQRVLLGSDICFWNKLVRPLFNLVQRAFRSGVRRVVITDPGRPTFYELADLCANRFETELSEWFAVEPNRVSGEVLEIRPRRTAADG
jgi:predicted nicotinamide N-methyase